MEGDTLRDYTLTTFSSPGDIDEVSARWRAAAGEEAYEVELVLLFDFCRENRAPRPGHGLVRGLKNESTGSIDAILETVPSPQRGMTKLLKIFVSPEFWPIDESNTDEISEELFEIHLSSYFCILEEATRENLDEVKMYGRSNVSLHLLKLIEKHWNSDTTNGVETGWRATMAGRWLVLTNDR
ncbi:hypothetical protein ACFQW6_13775 [Nocardioides sp. GCM10028917]|uniref:hypothetical protein n=1 Tax=Nocardioides sp. GCM10028917 TaxID=3273408 RepID=UPI003608AD63